MPLDQFIAETVSVLVSDADEILVEGRQGVSRQPGPNERALVNGFNQQAMALFGAVA
jgi:uncharacterized oxidoreductase